MKDRRDHDYAELLRIQTDHLAVWRERLKPDVMRGVHEFALRTNRAGKDGTHRVYRGQDLIEIIRQWPNLDATYAEQPETYEGI